jgi:hypothetical protein
MARIVTFQCIKCNFKLKTAKYFTIILMAAMLAAGMLSLAACSSMEASRNAQATDIAGSIFSTQTAQAPTATETLPPPTNTPTSTPTATPTMTRTATELPTETQTPTSVPDLSIPEGWQKHEGSGFSIGLPAGWEAVVVDEEGMKVLLESGLKGNDSEWAKMMVEMFTSEEMVDMLKLLAIGPEPVGAGYATVNIMFERLPFPVKAASLCAQLQFAYGEMGIELLDYDCNLEINQIPAARFMTVMQSRFNAVQQYQYVFVQGRDLWTVTLGVSDTEWASYKLTFEQIAGSFRAEELNN